MNLRVLILSQWYDPEPNIKSHGLAVDLQALGHTLTTLTGFPNYPTGKLLPGYRLRWREWIDTLPQRVCVLIKLTTQRLLGCIEKYYQ